MKKARLRIITTSIVYLTIFGAAYSQWDCRSMLGAYLKPLYEGSSISWAFELTTAIGKFDERVTANELIIPGIDLNLGNGTHQFYFEPAFKTWQRISPSEDSQEHGSGPAKKGLGFREGFYKLNLNTTQLTFGLQTMVLDDYLILDERVLGMQYRQGMGAFDLTASLGTVDRNFARMGDFCGTRRIYYTVKGTNAGEKLGETNIFGAVLRWTPSKIKEAEPESTDDAGSDDEFEDFGEFEEFEEQGPSIFKNAGLLYYQEFGNGFGENKFYAGALAEFTLPGEITLKNELLYQYVIADRTWAYFLEAEKPFVWDGGSVTSIEGGIMWKFEVDKGALFFPAFSNMYIGEITRMDSKDIPVAFITLEHKIPGGIQPIFRVRYVRQLENNEINEVDFEAIIKLFDHFKLAGIFGLLHSTPLKEDNIIFRLEIRTAI